MSVTSDFWKAMNESGTKVSGTSQKSTGGSSQKSSGGSSVTPTTKKKKKKSISDEFWEAMGDDDIAPVSSVATRVQSRANGGRLDIAPVTKSRKKDKEERSWFKKGLFEDGYDFGDISRTILGTTTDVLENVGSGIIGMGEKAVDAMAYIAPFAANGQFYQNGGFNLETEKAHREAVEQSKKDISKFIAKDLYDEEKVARAIISDPARKIGIDSETQSVFGEKSDALIQSGGQLLATAGLQAVGVPWFVTTGATSFGSEAENAMNQGAAYEEAGASAAISAGAEILSEKLSGGISFGGKTLDDALTKQLARGISNKLGRTAAKLGLDMAGEGAEEVFSQIASNLGSSLYKEEDITELLFNEEAMEGYLESFIGGAALGGVAGSYNAVKSNSKGVDYTSGLTQNEQKVVDKLYQDEIANQELTQKEKSKIYDSILEDMEKGYISTDTIEEVLGGDTYSAYKKTVDTEDAILKEYDELGEKQNATPKDYARYTELTEKVKNIHSNSQRNALRAKLNEDVMGIVQGSRLAESYNERARTGQKYEVDVTQYDAKQQAVVQKAIDSGILNNSRRTHEFVDFVSKISADTGVLFDFSNTAKIREAGFAVEGQTVDGFITKDGVTVNIDSPKSRQFVVGHEITHALEGSELYDALRKSVFDYAKMQNQYDVRMESIQKRYKEGTDYEAELTADLVGEYIFSDTDFVKNLSTQNRNVFQKVFDEIKYLCKVATAGSKEARELEKVKRAFEKAYREGGKTQGETKYSVSDSEGVELSKEQQDFFKDSVVRDENGNLKVMYHGTPNGNFTVFKDGTYFTDNKEYADRYQNPSASSISTGKVASNPKTFEVYLDIKKPFDINDAEVRNIYINDYIKGGNAMGINPYLSDAEYAKINSIDWTEGEDLRDFLIENEYDYDGLVLDEGGTGGYGDEVQSRGKSYVVFSPEQVKNIDNTKPTADPDIRFSLSEPVEETKDLIAVHNLTSEQVLKSLELGGLPMPSIAVLKADSVHDEYGDVSLILPKESIDPKANRSNKVYGGDAWTPVYPRIEYKPNAKVEKKISDKYYGLARRIGYDAVRPLYDYVTDLERQLNNASGETAMLKKLYDDTDMMNLYLQDSGKGKIELIEKETVTKISQAEAEMNQFFIDALGEDIVTSVWCPKGVHPAEHRKAFMTQHKTAIEDAYKRFCMEEFKFTEEEAENVVVNTSQRDLLTFVRDAARYVQNKGVTVKTEIDRQATEDAIRKAAADGYKEWVDGLFKGVEEKTGIRNNQDYYTRSGNPRSWDVLHWENTLENVVKVMKGQEETGTGSMSPYNSFASLVHKRYGSIAEIKADSNRLGKISQEEYEALGESFGNRFAGIAESIKDPAERNPFIALDNAAETIVEAVRTQKTKAGMLSYLQKWNKRVTQQTVDDVVALVNDIANMPTGYFEAKPQRAVGLEEVGVFVIPYDADVKLKQELLNKGYSIAEYDPKVEGDRQRVVNQFEEYKFSLSNVGEQHTPDSLSALRLDAPVAENATVQQETQLTEENSTVTTADMQELFPDDGADVHAELEDLQAEEAELRGVMEAYAGVGDIEAVNKLIPEHDAIRERIKELQQSETERADSLTDADVPMEMDAPISMKSENYDPFSGTTVYDIERSTRSYSDRNPGARLFLEEAALGFGYDVNNSTHGERWYNDQVYYESGGEQGFGGTSRHTTDDIAELKDAYGYTWDELAKAADDVAKGDFRSVAAKRVEYLCHKRLMEGYTDVDGRRYEPNQEYINFLNEIFANEQRAGSVDSLLESAPADIAPLKPPSKLKDMFTGDAPIFEGRDGQTTMFAPEKKTPTGGKTANVLTNEPKTPKRRNKFWSLIKEHVLDNGMVFEDLSKETGNRKIEAKWNFIRYSQSRAQRLIGNGSDGVKALKDIKKEVDKSGKTGQFYDYLYHKHNVDRMSLEDRFPNTTNKAVFGDSVTSEMSQRQVEQYETNNPEFLRWADDVYGYMNHLRNMLVENGVISQETADLWEEMYPHYVPIRRAGQDGVNINVPLDTYRTTVNNPIKKATGGNQDILPLFDTMAQRTLQTYKAIARNSFGIELKNTLGSVVDRNVETVDDVIDGIDTDDALLKPGAKDVNPTFTVFENGERVEFAITEDMYEAMKPKSEAMQYRNKILSTASNIFRGLTTQYSIPFMATNAIKDAQDVLINSQHPAKTYANFPRAWYQQLFNGKYYQEYIENGGEDNTYFDNETNTFDDGNWFKKGFDFLTKPVTEANNFIELTPRLAEYIASREAGRSVEVSMLDAARVTTNFQAGGDWTKFLNRNGVTFLNASVQGAVQQVRNIREAHHKGLMGYVGLATKFALAGLPTVLLNNLVWDDDEDYEELADYVKQDYYVIGKYDDGKFIRIPKGRTVAVIQNAIEQVQNAATGDDEVDLAAFLQLAVNNLAPNNPLENNILAPIGQAMANKTWYGEELVPSRLQDLPAAEQYDEKTDDFSRRLGEKLDISPYKINYLLNQYSGGLGDLILPMMTPRAESGDDSLMGTFTAPLRDKFTTDSVINSQVVTDYYDTKDALAVQANSSKATEDDYFRDLYMDTVGYELSDLYKQKREIQNSDMPDSEKYEQSRELQEQIVERMKQSLNSYDNINASGNYAEIGDKRYNKDADSGKWYEIKPKNADGSDNWYYQKEQEVTKGLGISYEEYWNNREEYNYAYDKPGKYAVAKAVGGYDSYMKHYDVLENWQSDSYLGADKDSQGNSISGSRKNKVIDYINGLDADYGEKIILYRTVYSSKADKKAYNNEIINYLNSRDDISYEEMKSILEELDMTVDEEGNISW